MLSPHPHGRNLTGVVWGGDRFVAVGTSVTQWSHDGVAWEMAVHDGVHLNGVAWGGTTFVAVGDGGVILRSPDGASWSLVESLTTDNLTGIAWGAGDFVAVSESQQAFRSTDGLAWDVLSIPAPQGALRGVVFADGAFCIYGNGGTIIVGSGTRWTALGGAANPQKTIASLAVLGGRYYAEIGATLEVFDGTYWHNLPQFYYGTLLGRAGSMLYIYTSVHDWRSVNSSADGAAWTMEPGPGQDLGLQALALGPDRAVAVGDYGSNLLRAGGTTWELTSGVTNLFTDVASNGRVLVLATTSRVSDTCWLLSSTDGREWTCRATGYASPTRVIWTGDRFVAFTWPSSVSWSLDGETWTSPRAIDGYQVPTDIVSFRGRYLALVGFGGYGCPVTCVIGHAAVLASPDLGSWQSVWHDDTKTGLLSVASNGSRLVATQCCKGSSWDLDGFLASDDGETWTPVSFPGELPLTTQIVWTGSRFVAAGGNVVMESTDGLSWSVVSRPSFAIHDLAWVGNALVAAATWERYPLVATSRDGRAWDRTYPFLQPRRPPTMPLSVEPWGTVSSLQSVAGSPRLQMAVGANGTLLRRECEPAPTFPRRRLGRARGASQP